MNARLRSDASRMDGVTQTWREEPAAPACRDQPELPRTSGDRVEAGGDRTGQTLRGRRESPWGWTPCVLPVDLGRVGLSGELHEALLPGIQNQAGKVHPELKNIT